MRQQILLLLATLTLLSSCEKTEEKPEIIRPAKVFKVSTGEFLSTVSLPGITQAENRVNLSFRVNGPLVSFPVDVGNQVKRNEILAEIDPRDYEVRLRNAKAQLEKSEAEYKFAESDYERVKRIQEKDPGAISQSAVDRKREDKNRLEAELLGKQADVEAAEDALEYTRLRAPFSGTIVATYVENHEFVRAKQSVVRMLDTSRLEMVVNVPETMISLVPAITNIEINLDPVPNRIFHAKIKEIGTEPSQTTRTYPVTLIIDQPDDVVVLAGMSGEARFLRGKSEELSVKGVEVPATSLVSYDGATYVWVVDKNTQTVSARKVSTERLTDRGVVVTGGLKSGEWIVAVGVNSLQEGHKIRPLPVILDPRGQLLSVTKENGKG